MREILRARAPAMHVSISSDVAPQIREVSAHVHGGDERLHDADHQAVSRGAAAGLKERGFPNDPLIMLSNGGVIEIDVASRYPVHMVESGPAAGALAAAYYAEVLGLDRLLSFDMGGTTAKACIIEDRAPLVVGNFEVDRIYSLQGRQRPAGSHSLGRHDRDRRRRRQHRRDQRSRPAQGRPARRRSPCPAVPPTAAAATSRR